MLSCFLTREHELLKCGEKTPAREAMREMVQHAGLLCLLTRRALLMDLMVKRNCFRVCVCVCVLGGGGSVRWKLLMNYNER